MTSARLRVLPLGAEEFSARVLPVLLEREAENNLLLGLARAVAASAERAAQALLLAVEADGVIVGAAARTPPHDLLVTRLPEGGAALIAEHVAALPEPITGVAGPEGAGLELAQSLQERLGVELRVRVRQLVYELTRLRPPAPARGAARVATAGDHELVRDGYAAFAQEVKLAHPGDAAEWAKAVIAGGGAWLWEDGEPQALACFGRNLPNGRSIGPVYTPPAARRRGYATSLVAELARQVLASGQRFACLFTDAANPTSNHIYESIGFVQVCRFDAYALECAGVCSPP
jgi:predicted GNAT family acetyltransferase